MAVIIFTSPTSGTASLDRIAHAVGREYEFVRINRMASATSGEAGIHIDPSAKRIYWFQGPRFWNSNIALENFKVIAHFRDPRDLACNQYWWALQHPNTHVSPEEAVLRRQQIEEAGIDDFVLQRTYSDLYKIYQQIDEKCAGTATYTSYTQLCSAFDYLVDSLCRVFERPATDFITKLLMERPENLVGNPNWAKIGAVWKGSDLGPGRFRRELEKQTQIAITQKFKNELSFCMNNEANFLRAHYR